MGYRFKIQAENFNGISSESPVGLMHSCTVPKDLDAPYIVSTSSTSMTLEWVAPSNDGGCPVTGYALFRDDGSSGVPDIEVNTADDPSIRNIPTLRRAVTEFDVADLGTKYAFQLKVYNREGETSSTVISYLFSTKPDTPSSGPAVLRQSSTLIQTENVFTDGTGGSQILSYNIQYGASYNGSMVDVIGGAGDPNALVTVLTLDNTYIQKGITYSFRYRVLNEKGWSDFSSETLVEAADPPSQPDAPALVSASSTSFQLEFNMGTIDNNGSQILSYRLESDGGVHSAAF